MTRATPNSIIMGDSNDHSSLWDPIHPRMDLQPRSAYTERSRITGNNSSLGLSLSGRACSTETPWTVVDLIGDSDYLPILIDLYHTVRYQPGLPRKPK